MWGLLLGAASVGVGYVIVATAVPTACRSGTTAPFVSVTSLALPALHLPRAVRVVHRRRRVIATLFGRRSDRDRAAVFRRPPRRRHCVRGRRLVHQLPSVRRRRSSWPAWSSRSPVCASPSAGARVHSFRSVHPDSCCWPSAWCDRACSLSSAPTRARPTSTSRRRGTRHGVAIFRVDVVDIGPDLRILYHDGSLGSAIHRWDGRPKRASAASGSTPTPGPPLRRWEDKPRTTC